MQFEYIGNAGDPSHFAEQIALVRAYGSKPAREMERHLAFLERGDVAFGEPVPPSGIPIECLKQNHIVGVYQFV